MSSSGYWDAQTAATYDESSAFMFEPEVLDPAVDFLADLAGVGAALELAIGTGRVAIPLTDRGVPVAGIELSQPMADELHRKRPDIPVAVGDMATKQGTSHHYRRHDDGTVTYGQSNFRYIWPAECDLMAQLAGMSLERRVADWHGAPFTDDSESHVSVWRMPA